MPRTRAPALNIPGARKTRAPDFIEPCNPKAGPVPFDGEWDVEVKYDGYRLQPHLRRDQVILFTRRGYDWTDKFPPIVSGLRALLPTHVAVFDGEVVVPDKQGRPDFNALQDDLHKRRTNRLLYFAYDVLYLDGYDLRGASLRTRRTILKDLIGDGNERVRFSENIEFDGANVFEHACRMGLEGIVSKRADSPYRSGDQDSWIKTKCKHTGSFPIVAFVEKLRARPRRIASLYLGRYERGKLLYAGKAQSGFEHDQLYRLREILDPYIIASSPLDEPIDKPKATWVNPVIQAEVYYSATTDNGRLRAPVYKGLREDLLTQPLASTLPRARDRRAARPAVARENILQLLPEAIAPTKDELCTYWKQIYKHALPYLARRPLKLVRHVHGTTFYHKGPLPPVPRSVHQLKVTKRSGGEGTRLWIDDLEGLLGLTQMGAVELHPWNATIDDIEVADTMVIDLDPGEGIQWSFLVDAALTLRELLHQEGYDSWPKLTGGKGIHLMIPLPEPVTHDTSHQRSRRIAEQLASTDPDRFTTSAALALRRGRLFLDFLRNGRGTTAIGAFSPRARPGHPIAAPTTWSAIESGIRPDAFTMAEPLPGTKGRRRASRPAYSRRRLKSI